MNEHEQQPHHGHAEGNRPAEDTGTPERDDGLKPRVWIGSLADYNAGVLTGEWIDAAVTDEELYGAAKAAVARSEDPAAEEWGIFDHDGFGVWKPGEYADLDIVATVARGIAEHGAAFAAWADLHDAEPDMLANFADAYLGEYDSPSGWAETMLDDLGVMAQLEAALPGDIARYIRLDTGAWAQDAWLSGDVHIVQRPGGGVWMFASR